MTIPALGVVVHHDSGESRFIVRWRWRRDPNYMTDDTWTCVECGETFEAEDDWTEEERLAELKREFGSQVSAADCVIICDECHELFMEHWKALQS